MTSREMCLHVCVRFMHHKSWELLYASLSSLFFYSRKWETENFEKNFSFSVYSRPIFYYNYFIVEVFLNHKIVSEAWQLIPPP